jgi:hypothetical protein
MILYHKRNNDMNRIFLLALLLVLLSGCTSTPTPQSSSIQSYLLQVGESDWQRLWDENGIIEFRTPDGRLIYLELIQDSEAF